MYIRYYFESLFFKGEDYQRVRSQTLILNRQGSWKTGEKENGSSEEEKKLEEKVEENSQKAEV